MSSLDTALTLMRMALAILDQEGEQTAACYLQHAIDVAAHEPVLQEGDEIAPELIARILGPIPEGGPGSVQPVRTIGVQT